MATVVIYINTDVLSRTQQKAHEMAISLGSRHDREACVEHCPPTSVSPQMVQWTGLWERSQRSSLAVSVRLSWLCFSSAVGSMWPLCSWGLHFHWPFSTGEWPPGLTLQKPGMNSWGWVGKRIVKGTSHLKLARGAVSWEEEESWEPSVAWSAEGQQQWVSLAGAGGSEQSLRRVSTVIISNSLSPSTCRIKVAARSRREGRLEHFKTWRASGQCRPSGLAWKAFLGGGETLALACFWPAFHERTFLSLCLSYGTFLSCL